MRISFSTFEIILSCLSSQHWKSGNDPKWSKVFVSLKKFLKVQFPTLNWRFLYFPLLKNFFSQSHLKYQNWPISDFLWNNAPTWSNPRLIRSRGSSVIIIGGTIWGQLRSNRPPKILTLLDPSNYSQVKPKLSYEINLKQHCFSQRAIRTARPREPKMAQSWEKLS